jgi:hypothetical protein
MGGQAEIAKIPNPLRLHRSIPRAGLAPGNDPSDSIEVEPVHGSEQWLARQEANRGWHVPKIVDSAEHALVLD